MTAFLKQFEIGRPQIIAACLLLALLLQAMWAINRPDWGADEARIVRESIALQSHSPAAAALSSRPLQASDIPDSILLYRVVGAVYAGGNWFELRTTGHLDTTQMFKILRFPFALFGVWLGGALWWVARRLFGNPGGYIALLLFCFSPSVVAMSSRINADVIAAWGLFGVVYTAIGVAHTLYAPPRSWPPRVLLLGAAFGFTFSAHFLAGFAGAVIAFAFMMYLAVGRCRAAIAVLAISLGIAALFLWACYGFSLHTWRSLAFGIGKLGWTHPEISLWVEVTARFAVINALILVFLVIASIYTIFALARARYFGNTAPWMVFASLGGLACLTGSTHANPSLLALPSVCLFVGGMSADWLESRRRRPARRRRAPSGSSRAIPPP